MSTEGKKDLPLDIICMSMDKNYLNGCPYYQQLTALLKKKKKNSLQLDNLEIVL